jgi:hypothetical protein
MPKAPIDYSKSIIYKIQHNEKSELIYIGATTDFTRRKYAHRNKANLAKTETHYKHTKLYDLIEKNGGWNNFTMTPIKPFPCKNCYELYEEEDKLIREMKSTLNVRGIETGVYFTLKE